MMNPVNKIHFNSSTGVSLNDRFTIMSKVSPGLDKAGAALGRGADGRGQGVSSGLRKRSNSVDSIPSRGSLANRAFVSQLDRRHMGGQHSQLRLRNRNIRSGRQKLNRNNITSRAQLRRAAGNTLTLVGGSRRMQRSNSLSDIATMNADFYERHTPLTRSNSQASLAARLGTNGRIGRSRSRGGRSLQRNQSRNRSRSNSGVRNGGGGGLGRPSRSRSRGGGQLGNGGRARSRSAAAYSGNGVGRGRGGGGRPMQRRNSYVPRSVSRSASVNGRLGGNRTSRPMSGGFRGGRIGKRGMRRGGAYGGGIVGRNGNNGGRPGRTLQRGRGGPRGGAGAGAANGGGIRRGRSRSRGRAPSQTRGRSAQRGRNASRGRFPAAPQKSKEQLDKELDTYMANTKSSLDKEMDEYMNGIHSSTI